MHPAYDIEILARDVVGLIDACWPGTRGSDRPRLGRGVAWWVAGKYPERLTQLVILNVPHLAIMFRTLLRSWTQMRRSWYIFFFQLPRLPEASLRRHNWTNAIRALKGSARRGTFDDVDLAAYRVAWSQPGAITGMINWYRAAVRRQGKMSRLGRIATHTLMIWGRTISPSAGKWPNPASICATTAGWSLSRRPATSCNMKSRRGSTI